MRKLDKFYYLCIALWVIGIFSALHILVMPSTTYAASEDHQIMTEEMELTTKHLNRVDYFQPPVSTFKQRGDSIVYYSEREMCLYYGNVEEGALKPIYHLNQPWKLRDYALTEDGKVAVATELIMERNYYGTSNHVDIILIDQKNPADTTVVTDFDGGFDLNHFGFGSLKITPDDRFIVIHGGGYEWNILQIYDIQTLKEVTINRDAFYSDYGPRYLGMLPDSHSIVLEFSEEPMMANVFIQDLMTNRKDYIQIKDFSIYEAVTTPAGKMGLVGMDSLQTQLGLYVIPDVTDKPESDEALNVQQAEVYVANNSFTGDKNPINDSQGDFLQTTTITKEFPAITKQQGNHFLYNNFNSLYYLNLASRQSRPVYLIENPWYLLDYTLSSNGIAVIAIEMSAGSLELSNFQNRIQLIKIDLNHPDEKPQVIKEFGSIPGEDLFILDEMILSEDGKYLMVDYTGMDDDAFQLYSLATMEELIELNRHDFWNVENLHEITFLDFLEDRESVIFNAIGDYNRVLEYSLADQVVVEGWLKNFYITDHLHGKDNKVYLIGNNYFDSGMQIFTYDTPKRINAYRDQLKINEFMGLLGGLDQKLTEQLVDNAEDNMVISVGNAQELVEAIGPDRTIILQAGTYDFDKLESRNSQYVDINVDPAIRIHDVDNLTLTVKGDYVVEFVIPDVYQRVIDLVNVSNVTINGIFAGHSSDATGCAEGVMMITQSQNVRLYNSILFGCGVYGFEANDVEGLTVNNSLVTDCSAYIFSMTNVQDGLVLNSKFVDNRGSDLSSFYKSNVEFDRCIWRDNESNYQLLSISESKILIRNSQITGNQYWGVGIDQLPIEFIQTVIEDNTVVEN